MTSGCLFDVFSIKRAHTQREHSFYSLSREISGNREAGTTFSIYICLVHCAHTFSYLIILQLKRGNRALKAIVAAAEKHDAPHNKDAIISNVLRKISGIFSFFFFRGSVSSVEVAIWRLHCHSMVLYYTLKVYHTNTGSTYHSCTYDIHITGWLP